MCQLNNLPFSDSFEKPFLSYMTLSFTFEFVLDSLFYRFITSVKPHCFKYWSFIIDFIIDNKWLLAYLLIINIITFALFVIDKWKAVHGRWRIRTITLMGFALAGGTVGGLLAMYIFRHKTKTASFTVGLPVMLVVQVVILWCVYKGL